MDDERLTFEEQKLREDSNVLFNGIFTAGTVGLMLLFLVSLVTGGIEQIREPQVRFYLRTALVPLLRSAAVLLPFLIYNHRQNRPLSGREKEQKTNLFQVVLCAVAAVGAGIAARWLSDVIRGVLTEHGYVVSGGSMPLGGGVIQNAVYILLPTLIYAAAYTVTYSMTATDKLSRINVGAALVLPAMICALSTVSFDNVLCVFVIGFFSAWAYIKTMSAWATAAVWASGLGAVGVYDVCGVNMTAGAAVAVAVAVAAALVLVLVFGVPKRLPMRYAEEGQPLSGGKTLLGLARAEIFWIFFIAAVVALVFTGLADPDFEVPGMDTAGRMMQNIKTQM